MISVVDLLSPSAGGLLTMLALLAVLHAASGAFEDVDVNHDESIDRDEFARISPALEAFGGALHALDSAAKTMAADPVALGSGSAMNLSILHGEGFVSAFFNALVGYLFTADFDVTIFSISVKY
jgi:hypothetical protein